MSHNKLYEMKNVRHNIVSWFKDMALVWRREFRLVTTDVGVMLFFIALPLVYPIVYTLIYNPEVVRDIPIAVVDNCRSQQSRELVRMADATEAMAVAGYAASLSEARRWMDEKGVYGIMVIPQDYSQKLGRGEQAVVSFYSDMSLLLRYRAFLTAITDIQLATGARMRSETLSAIGVTSTSSSPVNNESFFLGDTEQGFASFVIPGIVVLILQQSMVLGITMIGGTSRERRRRNGGIDPLEIQALPSATVIGKMLCYLVIYAPLAIYILHYIPVMFSLPHIGDMADFLLFIFPMLIATAFFGLTLQIFVKERETSLLVIVFTSVIFLFLSGLTWPRYAMNSVWTFLGDCVPAVWGVEGFIRINSNGATLADNAHSYTMLWVLAGVYFLLSCVVVRFLRKRDRRLYAA